MAIQIPGPAIRRALTICSSAAGKPPSDLANKVRVYCNGEVRFEATDKEKFASVTVSNQTVDGADSFVLPIDRMTSIARESGDGEILIDPSGSGVRIESSAGVWTFPKDSIAMPRKECVPATSFALESETLASIVKWTDFASTGSADVRCLGVILEIKKGTLHALSTDGRRMSMFRQKIDGPDIKCRVPGSLLKMAESLREHVTVHVGATDVGFRSPVGYVCGAQVDGATPKFDKFWDSYSHKPVGTVSPAALAAVARSAGIVSETETRRVLLSVKGGRLEVASSSVTGEAKAQCDVEGSGEMSGLFNVRFIEQAASTLASLHSGPAEIGMERDHMFIRGGDFCHIVLAMREVNP